MKLTLAIDNDVCHDTQDDNQVVTDHQAEPGIPI